MTFACAATLTLMDIPHTQTDANWPGYEYGDQATWDGLRTKLEGGLEKAQSVAGDVILDLTKNEIMCWVAVFAVTAGDSDCPLSDDAVGEFYDATGSRE